MYPQIIISCFWISIKFFLFLFNQFFQGCLHRVDRYLLVFEKNTWLRPEGALRYVKHGHPSNSVDLERNHLMKLFLIAEIRDDHHDQISCLFWLTCFIQKESLH